MKELSSFISEDWMYLGQWHQPTICNGFWCYWHTTSAVRRLLPDIQFHTLLNPGGHFWIAKEDVASFHSLFDSLDKDRTHTLISHLRTIGEEAVKNHLGILENQEKHYSEYLPELFSTYKELSGVWTLAWLGDELGAYMVKKDIYTEEVLLNIVSRNVRSTWLIEEYQSVKNIGTVLVDRHGLLHPDELTESFLAENSEIMDLIEAHVRKYEWFGTHHWMGEAYTIEKCLVEVREYLRKKEEKDIKEDALLSKEWHFLTALLLEFAYWRTHAAEVTVKVVFFSREKMEECARDLSLSYDDLIFLSDEEILDSIHQKESVVSKETIEERKNGQGCYLEGEKLMVVSGQGLHQILESLKSDTVKIDLGLREFTGTVACRGGIVTGRVSILISPGDFKNFLPGNILVVPETTPDFVPFMQSALAIITERGGITSHAAIVAREMKKPCIIGTKIATQVLHDGDLVEVDADNGVVRVIERVSDALYNKDTHWTHYLTRPFTLFGASLWQEWYNSPETFKVLGSQMKNALFIEQVPGVARNYRKYDELEDHKRCVKTLCEQNAQKVKAFLEEGVLLNQEAKKYLSGEMKFVDIASAVDFLICLSLRATILPYWVIAFSEDITYQDTQLLTLAEDIRSVSLYPNLVSQVIIPLAEEELHARGLDPSVLPYMTLQELLSGAAEVASQRMSPSHRRKFFVYQVLDGAENVSFVSDPAAVIATLEHVDDHDGVRGQTVFQGNVKGIARIVYSIDEKKEFNMGDILVSINSNPSLLPLIHKCGAIITDEGGIMCHAAIVARELKKPCIIGTKIATQVLHDGDLVEVNANEGVVRILERAREPLVSTKGEPLLIQAGRVERGSKQAKTLGFPTANIPYEREGIAGTYAGQVTVHGAVYKAAVYADPKRGVLEAHLFDFSGDLYGREIGIVLLAHIADAAVFTPETSETDVRAFLTDVVQKVKDYFQI